MSWKETCSLDDWSLQWQHRFTGPDARRLISDFSVNTTEQGQLGQSKHAIHTNRDGKVIHEGIVTRFADEDFVAHGRGGLLAEPPARAGRLRRHLHAGGLVRPPDRRTGLMRISQVRVAGHQVWALRQGPRERGQEIHDLLMTAGEPFGIRRIGARVTPINHLEASYPTLATDSIPAIFDPELADYLTEFRASMPNFAQPAYIAGSYDGQQISAYYRSAVELGWARKSSLPPRTRRTAAEQT